MAIINNLRSNQKSGKSAVDIPEHYPYVDVLFDYAQYLRDIDINEGIGKYKSGNTTVAIVGTGVAGITAAYELLCSGVPNVKLFTPDDLETRPYGRCNSVPFTEQPEKGNKIIAELGAMRFPVSEVALFHYVKKFDIPYSNNFPDPGKVDTLLCVGGKSYTWKAGEEPPSIFEKVSKGWKALINDGFTTASGIKLIAPATIADSLKKQDTETASEEWQKWITAFTGYSFRSALGMIFQAPETPPGGEKWTEEDIELFGTLGLGSGGFNPLYNIAFTEMLRLFVNELETDQQFIPSGIQSVIDKIATDPVGPKKQTVIENITQIKLESFIKVSTLDESEPHQYSMNIGNQFIKCDYIIFALPTWSLQLYFTSGVVGLSNLKSKKGIPVFKSEKIKAISNQHLISSAKIFIQTNSKFWLKEQDCFSNIQSDTIGHGLYCLDYNPDDPDGYGVVLISYTWEDDARKLEALLPKIPDGFKLEKILSPLSAIPAARPTFNAILQGVVEVKSVFWSLEPSYNGGFKLNQAGQDLETQNLYWDYVKSADKDTDSQVYFAGDSGSFYGGWIEGAFQTGLNAATAVMKSLENQGLAENIVEKNPVDSNSATKYNYNVGQD